MIDAIKELERHVKQYEYSMEYVKFIPYGIDNDIFFKDLYVFVEFAQIVEDGLIVKNKEQKVFNNIEPVYISSRVIKGT